MGLAQENIPLLPPMSADGWVQLPVGTGFCAKRGVIYSFPTWKSTKMLNQILRWSMPWLIAASSIEGPLLQWALRPLPP